MYPKEKEGRSFTIGLRNFDSSNPNLNDMSITPILESKLIEICQNSEHPRRGDLVISLNSTDTSLSRKPNAIPAIETKKKGDLVVTTSLTPKMLKVLFD